MRPAVLATILLLAAVGAAFARPLPALRDGDIIFHESRSAQSQAIQRATGSRYSHMGLVVHRGGRPCVLEAISTVQLTPLDRWIARGAGRHFVVKRLRDADAILTPRAVAALSAAAFRYQRKPYDSAFGWSDERMYCSELVWKAYERGLGIRIGDVQRLRDFDLSSPEVRAKLRERYGQRIPLDEIVISPVAIFRSPRLVTVAER